jgi:hypothetical protein
MALASRWAEDPELVEQAEQQDRKVVTSKKGQPLVSKWADVNDEEEVKELGHVDDVKEVGHVKEVKMKKESRHSPRKRDRADDISSRLASVHLHEQPDDQTEVDNVRDDSKSKIAPTKAAADFAARLGISISGNDNNSREQERQRNRERKMKADDEWNKSKDGISFRRDSPMRGQREPISFKNTRDHRDHTFKRETRDHRNREPVSFKRNSKKQKEPEPEEDKPFDQEEFDRLFAKEKQLNQDIANGKKVDWADFDDDYEF